MLAVKQNFFQFFSILSIFIVLPLYGIHGEKSCKKSNNFANKNVGIGEHQVINDDDFVLGNELKTFTNENKNVNQIPYWLVVPFILLLLMIATGPLLYENFWHKHYPKIAVSLALFVGGYYVFILKNYHKPVESLAEYVQFIALITALYIASSGLYISINKKPSALLNIIVLCSGAVISNLIGTTGASMLLIRPYMRLNENRLRVYHIIFFIFIVSNIGGALTPIGDPPLFLGFLKGVPFFWTTINNFFPWLIAISLLSIIFYFIDSVNKSDTNLNTVKKLTVTVRGKKNFIFLFLILVCVFLDPTIFGNVIPSISYHGHKYSFLREFLMLLIAFASYKTTSKNIFKDNDFSFEPLLEVVFIFIGIFGTMYPAMELISIFSESNTGKSIINSHSLFWGAGIVSSFLDNTPAFINFLTASMGSQGANISSISDVKSYAAGNIFVNSLINLKAIALSSVFFGAMTYIGNGPNFMVKSIATKQGVKMPSFFCYIFKYSMIILLPILVITWFLFFYL